ncbi:hypothetical protein [Hufsiella ginkgonis]|uniref:Cupin domain-containing protein n=1 Tax=Hufsiella ginkgonis TaxID=2695274 RepID=A0A7K1XUT0_9SPHI|nr:hypothetical protein [Hufsiella ginkgonis]MXV14246.1 hypothetical protein [Hufsiella ginkgonis]
MIEKIIKENCVLATIIKSAFKAEGIVFFTAPELPQQMGYMNRPKGYLINAHRHNHEEIVVKQSCETLIVRKGSVKVFLYDEADNFFAETTIETGDVMLLSGYGHGFEMLEDSELIEIKQGPYSGDQYNLPLNVHSTKSCHG